MQLKKVMFAVLAISSLTLAGCAELQGIGQSAKDGAVMRAKMEASTKASEAVGKVTGSKF
ncbi:hypothetical protein [Actinobacillus minor]|uniref:Entericidin EcnAB n=1 Tax=Actinobacillus minor NM305 TaxID=637911 RepID=C5RZB6_9PAST|nr:hypothetical protein [Actinobacillus minor]EER47999.1 hypothetical protein AM305_05048 [Actinobacillus minor NM305]MDD6910726.1 hypothetical protein [Actinobacillus minor]MDY4713673.1 hypothetical protein [Actinobacillus minor]MDY5107039.1 hypothetical protein [Actinobacillus minor]